MEQSATCAASPICVAAVFQTFSENILVCLGSVFRRRHSRLCDVTFVNCALTEVTVYYYYYHYFT